MSTIQEQITALEARAEQLLEQRIAVMKQITELRGQLEGVQYVRVGIDAPTRRQEPLSPVFAAQITDYLEDHPGVAVGEIADAIASTPMRVGDALRRLEALQTVHRTGIKRGTKWWLGEQGEDAALRNPAPDVRDAQALVRDIAVELSKGGGFTISDVLDACDLSQGTVLRWLRHLIERGMLEVETVQTEITAGGHKRMGWVKMYAYVEPKATPLPERKKSPEEELKGKDVQRKAGVVGGTPNWYRRMNDVGREFVRELEAAGCEIRAARGSGHVKVLYQGSFVGGISWLSGEGSAAQVEINRRQFIEKGVPLRSPAAA